jgi:hypothetical protein
MDRHELEAMTKEELVSYADAHNIEVNVHWVKDDIIKEILKAQKKAATTETKPERKTSMATETTATARRPTSDERATQMNLYTEEQRKLREGDEKRRTFVVQINELESKAQLIEDEESRNALLECVDTMRTKVEEQQAEADEEAARRAEEAQQQAAE